MQGAANAAASAAVDEPDRGQAGEQCVVKRLIDLVQRLFHSQPMQFDFSCCVRLVTPGDWERASLL